MEDRSIGAQPLLAPLSVLIADDLPIVREGLAALANSRSDMRVVAEAAKRSQNF